MVLYTFSLATMFLNIKEVFKVKNLKNRCQDELKELKEQCRKTTFVIGKYLKYIDYMEVNRLCSEIEQKLDVLLMLSDKMENFHGGVIDD